MTSGSDLPTTAPKTRRTLAVQISVAALVVSVVSLILSTIALVDSSGTDGDSTPINSGPVVTLLPTTTTPSGTGPTATSSATGSTATGGQAAAAYPTQTLTLSPGTGCSGSRAVDLDEPAVGSTDKATDLRYRWSCTRGVPGTLTFTGEQVAKAPDTSATAQQCLDAVRTAPISTEVTPTKDLALCVVTNGITGKQSTGKPLIALLTITKVGTDSTLTVDVTGWTMPG